MERRVRVIKEGARKPGPAVYWMSRDQRASDNWALLFAQSLAIRENSPLVVVFCLARSFLGAAARQYGFMIRGLAEASSSLREHGIPLLLLKGEPGREVAAFTRRMGASSLVTDFDPLNIKRAWKEQVASRITIPMYEVDAHNIVPCWLASGKQEYAARTFRPKVRRMLKDFLTGFPRLRRHPYPPALEPSEIDVERLMRWLRVDKSVPEVGWCAPGEAAARRRLGAFIRKGIGGYAARRNDPAVQGQSGLSPYLHFGQISAQRVALEVASARAPGPDKDAFLEELIVRRELADNFCHYNRLYDSFEAFPDWARQTLDAHRKDRREHIYSLAELEAGRTHDRLWNAAQAEMVKSGKMHGYMRMYWAKKILEWSRSPEEALRAAISLNDRYELDGRDPNGYAGAAWSIGGVHDRAWKERDVFGKVRYMSYSGCEGKFDIDAYVRKVNGLPGGQPD